jgi:hypothetical protein
MLPGEAAIRADAETAMGQDALRLQHAAAVACGILAALTVHIVLVVSGYGLQTVLRSSAPSDAQQMTSSLAWWAIGASGFVGGFASGAYLIAAARSRHVIAMIARRLLIVVVLAVCTTAGILSKVGGLGGGMDVLASLTALSLAVLSAYCGTRFAYLRAGRDSSGAQPIGGTEPPAQY